MLIVRQQTLIAGVFAMFWSSYGWGSDKDKNTQIASVAALPMPIEAASWQSLDRGLASALVLDNRIISFSIDKPHVFDTPLKNIAAQTRDGVFGGLLDSKRVMAYNEMVTPLVIGAFAAGAKIIAINAHEFSAIELDAKTLKEVWRRTIPMDMIKPAADRGGEATRGETEATRSALNKAVAKRKRFSLAGMAELPASWWSQPSRRSFLLLTRLAGFPLVILECSDSEPSQCLVTRKCNLEAKPPLDSESLAGIAVDASKKQILIGDKAGHKIVSFKFQSCFHIPQTGTILLPAKMKGLSNITVDKAGHLWVTAEEPDDYLNASLYLFKR